jgi:hypothetical protein
MCHYLLGVDLLLIEEERAFVVLKILNLPRRLFRLFHSLLESLFTTTAFFAQMLVPDK